MLRLIHTADWHLGHTLHGFDRHWEHQRFLQWLLETIVTRQVDVLLVAGDIFHTANPSNAAMTLYFQFIADLCRHAPQVQIVLTAGNHDSPLRLESSADLLSVLGVRVVGSMPYSRQDYDKIVVPMRNATGEVEAWCGAVPFLRLADLPVQADEEDVAGGVSAVYAQVWQALQHNRQPGQGVVLTGHCYMAGGDLSEWSERKILLGNQHALPVAMFGEEVAYVALGHLHLAQRVGGRERVRYSGSPIPLSMQERGYRHQVLLVEMEGEQVQAITPLPVPRSVEFLKVPQQGGVTLDEMLPLLAQLPEGQQNERSPYLEVVVKATTAEMVTRQRIEEALLNKGVRLVKITLQRPGQETGSKPFSTANLVDLAAEEIFKRKYQQHYGQEPPNDWLAAFHELVDAADQEEAG